MNNTWTAVQTRGISRRSLGGPAVESELDGVHVEEEPGFHLKVAIGHLHPRKSGLGNFQLDLAIELASVEQAWTDKNRSNSTPIIL